MLLLPKQPSWPPQGRRTAPKTALVLEMQAREARKRRWGYLRYQYQYKRYIYTPENKCSISRQSRKRNGNVWLLKYSKELGRAWSPPHANFGSPPGGQLFKGITQQKLAEKTWTVKPRWETTSTDKRHLRLNPRFTKDGKVRDTSYWWFRNPANQLIRI